MPPKLNPLSISSTSRPSHLIEHDEPTPTKAVFDLGVDEQEDNSEDHEEDEEFQSHYSRQSSASSVSDSENDSDSFDPVQRVNSMPTSFSQHPSLPTSRSTTALRAPPLPPPLYPPFYNKPPTPLPPSPSLTSLLRPPSLLARSTTSTRPTSPDSSDVETPNDTEAQVIVSARRANPLPPTAPKVPTYEYYGFVLYLASSLAFLIYLLWSYLPSPFLHALGITYYPDRWWALAIPAWLVVLIVYIYVALACYNTEILTLAMDRLETMVDEAGSVAILDEGGRIRKGGSKKFVEELDRRRDVERRQGMKKKSKKKKKEEDWFGYVGEVTEFGIESGLSWRQIWSHGTDAVLDVPLGGVCEVLYGEGRNSL